MDWEKIRKIDAHVHLIPWEVHQANPDSDDEFSQAKIECHIQLMNRYNIEKAILMPFNDPFVMSMDFTAEAVHRNLIEMCSQYPEHYYAFADIDTRNPVGLSCQAVKKALKNPYLRGLKIHPSNTGMNADNLYYETVAAAAAEGDYPVAFHSYPRNNRDDVCAPGRIAGLIQKHPEWKIIICHMGAFQWRDILESPVYVDISAILPDYVKEYGIPKTNQILRQFGVQRLLFATDWPFSRSLEPADIYERYFDILNQMDFTEKEAEDIAYNNAMKLFSVLH